MVQARLPPQLQHPIFGIFCDVSEGSPTILLEAGSRIEIMDGAVKVLDTEDMPARPRDLESGTVALAKVTCWPINSIPHLAAESSLTECRKNGKQIQGMSHCGCLTLTRSLHGQEIDRSADMYSSFISLPRQLFAISCRRLKLSSSLN